MPEAQSIWTRPLGRKFWTWSGGLCLVLLLGTAVFPLAWSTGVWLGHRNVSYRNSTIPLPFRWSEDGDSIPLTIEKIAWHFAPSNLFIERLEIGDEKTKLDKIRRLDQLVHHQYPLGRAPDAFTAPDGRQLLCSEDITRRFVQMDCWSRDAGWMFNYLGDADDARDVNAVVQYVLQHEGDFR